MTTSRPDDLASLFGPEPSGAAQSMRFRQGVVQSWDPVTANNTVLVGNTVMTDLPVLNTSEALLLAAGDTVSIVVVGDDTGGARSYGIWGRMTIPGTSQAASALRALQVYAEFDTTNGSTTSALTFTDLTGTSAGPAVTAPIGATGRVKVTLSAHMESTFDPSLGALCAMGVDIAGANTLPASGNGSLTMYNSLTGAPYPGTLQHYILRASYTQYFDGLTPGLTTFTCKYTSGSSGTTAQFADRTIIVEPL
jgi:hypothetical protein